MKKVYIAPETLIVSVKLEGAMLSYSIDNTGAGGADGEKNPVIEGNPEDGEVGAKGDNWSGGISIWED
ncbi:MAG: hypothetical protein ACI3YF_08730 [Prevotella sp.]